MSNAVVDGFLITLQYFWLVPLGAMVGMIVGAIPGLSPPNALAAMIPVLIVLSPEAGLIFCISLYAGAEMGNSFPAVMINIPGTAAAAVTALEGYELKKQGRAARALGVCIMASTIGALIGGVASISSAPLLAELALRFSAVEISIIIVFGLVVIAQISAGGLAKGLFAGFFGLMLATAGTDPLWGQMRGTFGSSYLFDGISTVAALVGLLGFSELLIIIEGNNKAQRDLSSVKLGLSEIVKGFKIVLRRPFQCLRAGGIGVAVGMVPGAGGSAASFVAYQQSNAFASPKAKKFFGRGSYEGLLAADTANNAMVGGALVPLLTLGLPGSATMVVVLIIMQYHGLEVGPRLFETSGPLAYAVLWSQFLAAPFILIFGTLLASVAYRVAYVPNNILVPIVAVFCIIGALTRNEILFDVWVMLIFGVIGYFMKKNGYPVIALLLGLLLGHYFEGNVFRSLRMGFGSPEVFFTRPIAIVLWLLLVSVVVVPIISKWYSVRKQADVFDGRS
ncbi:MAG: tripartite tricarboxylate transporter permease [Pseudorhodobacter sp.]|nr:tripartite tricarboxylate transporter permease [Pseudorhodobacter sp.]